ncbi:hypothetical protein TNCV_3317571 [Trichonephila clavipes]|nr:hypothetical protein TNCV_3317571 [Trichonephila clavipes]
MVSPAGQGQERHPSIVPGFLSSTSWGVTSARGHGAIVYCLNSGSEGFVNGILETGGGMDKCVQMWTRNYGALGQTARVCFGVLYANKKKEEETRDPEKEKRGGDPKGEVEEKSSEKTRAGRLRKRRGESQSFFIRVAVQESKTRMKNNALRTGPRQAVERAVSKRGYHTGYRHGNY